MRTRTNGKESGKEVAISLGVHSPHDMMEILTDRTIKTVKIDNEGDDPEARFQWKKRPTMQLGYFHLLIEELVIDADVEFNTLVRLAYMKSLKKLSFRRSYRNMEIQRFDLKPLSKCESLEELRIKTDGGYLDLSFLAECKNLRSIDLSSSSIIGVSLPSCASLAHVNLSHTNVVSRYMMEKWRALYGEELLRFYETPSEHNPYGMPRAAVAYWSLQMDELLDLSQIRGCTSLRTLDLSSGDRLHAIDLSVLAGTGVRPQVILTDSPIHQYCVDGFEGEVVLPRYDSVRMKHPPMRVDKNGQEVR